MAKKAASSTSGGTKPAPKKAPAKSARAAGRAKGAKGHAEDDLAPAPIRIPIPGPLSAILGQPRALSTLITAFTSGRLHHAWIFHGPKGVGKMTTALAFARAALDPTTTIAPSGLPEPDPASDVQRMLSSGTHPDLHVIVKEYARFHEDRAVRDKKLATIPKEVIEEHLIDPIMLAPAIRDHGLVSKVFIIDEAELLDRHLSHAPVQNAILKTLEEPPPGSLVILVTSSEERLLPTIRSRCQRVAFAPLESQDMQRWLATRPEISLPSDERDWLMEYAAGSPGAMLSAIERGMGAWRLALGPALDRVVRGEFPTELGKVLYDLSEGWAKEEVERNRNASKETANRVGTRLVLKVVADRLRKELRRLAASPETAERAERFAHAIDAIREAERFVDSNVNVQFVMEGVVVQLAASLRARPLTPAR